MGLDVLSLHHPVNINRGHCSWSVMSLYFFLPAFQRSSSSPIKTTRKDVLIDGLINSAY